MYIISNVLVKSSKLCNKWRLDEKELYTHICFVHYAGTTYIKKLLLENKRLQHLNIGSNKIGDDGVRHVTEGLHHNDTLTELMLHDCKISVKGNNIKIDCG